MPFGFLLAPAGGEIAWSLLLVFVSAKLLAELFEQVNQPGIVGEIIAGILIGPSVLGWMRPNDVLAILAELGVTFLLFRVGLDVKSSELLRVGGTSLVVAILGVALPFLLGWGIVRLWGSAGREAVFVGAAMVATSVGITAQVLAGMGLLQERASKIILAAAVIDDVLGLLVLALVSGVVRGQVNYLALVLTGAGALGFTLLVAKWGSRAMDKVVPKVQANLKIVEAQFTLSLSLLFVLAFVAAHAGVAAIIGAFLAGMALSESVDRRVHDLTHGVTELLLPFFLAGIGMHLDPAAFSGLSTLLLALVILAAAVLSKFIGCGLGALPLGRADAVRVGVGMMPRGEVGMVVAQIGLGMGVMAQNIYGVVVFMSVATTLVAPPLLRLAYRDLIPQKAEERMRLG